MNNTFVKLYRKVLDNHFLANDNNAYLMFTKLLLKVDYNTGTITLGRKQLSHLCNMKESTTYATANRLVDNNLITTQANRKFTKITVVNWSKYQGGKTTAQQPNDEMMSEAWLNDNTIKRTKKKKKNITNVIGKPEINELFDYWLEKTGIPISSKIQMNRNACNNLFNKNGMEKTKKLIDGVALAQTDKYAPGIADFIQLQSKLSELLVWGKKNTKKTVTIPPIKSQEQTPDYRGAESPAKEKLRKDLEKLRIKVTV